MDACSAHVNEQLSGSGHSTFSAAAAQVLAALAGSDAFGYSVTFPAGSPAVKPGAAPARALVLSWETHTEAAH